MRVVPSLCLVLVAAGCFATTKEGAKVRVTRNPEVVAMAKNGTALLRLPYSETRYLASTGGVRYDR